MRNVYYVNTCCCRSRVSSDIECRVLVPAVSQAFDELLKQGQCGAVAPLLSVLSEGFTKASDLTPELVSFFTGALGLRSSSPGVSLTEIATMEDAVIDCLTSVVLKLSESAFRPLYYRLYNWAVRAEVGRVERAITFYRLSSRIAESLKGLFVLFAGHFVSDAARLLDENNADKKQTDDDVTTSCLLLDSVLRTLLTVFTYDSKHFVTKERFNILLQPLVDQLENLTGGCEVAKERWDKLVTPCLAEMAASTPDDTLWKQLSYQILLKTRHHSPLVRIAGLKTVHELARKLGEDFLPLLPEAVPFLAELLEDDEESVEKECQRVVADMEAILGEPIQKYF
ncbi:hypothetical protein AAG570_014102 [Ranatra chinensis]|uniref:HEAT repeat-containing protein 1 n=1 Tax=Ranatra chinensis TaxID=642074 RepID=A0ABD0XUL4_9HEMI